MPRTPATLTKTAILALPRNSELRDHIVPGLSIWRAERGRGWSLTYASPLTGKRRRLKLGSPDTGMDLEAARAAARAQLSLLARGIDPRDPPKETTISGAIDRYERDRLGERRTGPEIARIIRKELGQRCGSLPIEELRRQHLTAMFGEIKDRGAPILANRTLGYVVTMLNWSVAVGLLEQSPAHGLKRHLRTKERPRSRVLNDVELRRVWAATFTSDGFPAWYGALVRLAILTGQRRGEIAALQEEWIDGAWITVPADFYKTERPHRFYLTDLARTQLPVPRRDGRRFPSDPPWSRHKLALERATRLDGWTLHDLRRTFATGLVKMGEHSDLVELCIGHVQQGIRATYQHYSFEKEKRRAFERWSEYVAALVA